MEDTKTGEDREERKDEEESRRQMRGAGCPVKIRFKSVPFRSHGNGTAS